MGLIVLAAIIFIYERRERKKHTISAVSDVQLEPMPDVIHVVDPSEQSLYQTIDVQQGEAQELDAYQPLANDSIAQQSSAPVYSSINRVAIVDTVEPHRPSYSMPVRKLRLNTVQTPPAATGDTDETVFGFTPVDLLTRTMTQFEQPDDIMQARATMAMPYSEVRRWNPGYTDDESTEDV